MAINDEGIQIKYEQAKKLHFSQFDEVMETFDKVNRFIDISLSVIDRVDRLATVYIDIVKTLNMTIERVNALSRIVSASKIVHPDHTTGKVTAK